ncbi:MAG: DUF1523 family protein [Cyclobacteriaceae bacterium]|nr:DUF1523 family protein [Cyclobacteriaceae bacterium]
MFSKFRNLSAIEMGIIGVFLLVGVTLIVGAIGAWVHNDYQGVLNSSERVCRGSGDSLECHYEWRFRGTAGYADEVFVNRDSVLNAKFNSADFQNRIDTGQEYTLVVTGWRIPILSMFRNVIAVRAVE